MKRLDTIQKAWDSYELLDSGEGRKLERFGALLLDRPDPQALWKKTLPVDRWATANAQFLWTQKQEKWNLEKDVVPTWNFSYKTITLELSFPSFKHVGVFPEHATQWDTIIRIGEEEKNLRMLNLFGYTGAASVAGASVGMKVTHVDASKTTIGTVKKNTTLSNLSTDAIRTVCEDALKYAKRLVERGEQFEVIVMDPPAFGRGPKGEVWKIEESLRELLGLIPRLLSKEARLVILNGYAAGYSARTFAELLHDILPKGDITYGDVGIEQKGGDRILPTGIYATWTR